MGDKKSDISVEYLVDLLSSIKSALSNIESNNNDVQNLISDLSENFTVLSELSKRQYQDGKEMSSHLVIIQESIHELNLSNQMARSDLGNKIDHLIELMNLFGEMQKDIHFIAENIRKDNIVKTTTDEVKRESDSNFLVKLSGNLNKIFTNLDVVGKSIIGILLSIAMLISVFKAAGGSFSDISSLATNIITIGKDK